MLKSLKQNDYNDLFALARQSWIRLCRNLQPVLRIASGEPGQRSALSAEKLALQIDQFLDVEIAKVESVGKFVTGNKAQDLQLIQAAQEVNPEFETFSSRTI